MAQGETYFKILWLLVSLLQLQQGYSEGLLKYKLESVQVLFRHGDRTPRKDELYPKLPYNASIYDPIGLGQLNEIGRNRAYRLGTVLRREYDHFLGDYPRPGDVLATSTDIDRTKATLQLVLVGLYPSRNDQPNWTPVPTSYVPLIVDMLLMPQLCPLYMKEFKRVRKLPEIERQISRYRELSELVGENTGLNVTSIPILSIFGTYQLLESQKSMNIQIPEWVTPEVRTEMEDAVAFTYELLSYSTKLKRLSGGPIIKQFIENLNLDGKHKKSPKIFLYSAHDLNIASFAKASGFKEPQIPRYTSMIVLEKWRHPLNITFVRIRFWTGITEEWITYTIPGCAKICPADLYVYLMRDIIPTDEELKYLWNSVTKDDLYKYYKEKGEHNPFPVPNKNDL